MRLYYFNCAVLLLVVCPLAAFGEDLVVSGESVTIDTDMEIDGSIFVENGGILTIRNAHVTYTVSLAVTGPAGSNSVTKAEHITVSGDAPGSMVRQLLPGQAWAEGAEQTSWLSEMWVFNPGSSKSVELGFWPNDIDNSNAVSLRTIDIAAGSYLAEDDLLEFLGVPFNSVGTVFLDFELDGSRDQPLVTGARTYNDVEDGTFGQYIWAVGPDAEAELSMVLPGAIRSEAFRTNLGLVNGGTADLPFTVTLLGATKSYTILPQSSRQLNDIFAALGISDNGIGTAVVTAHGPGGAAYLSIIDNFTGDPTYLGPLTLMTEAYLPGCARAPGALGTQWYSDAIFANLGAAAVDITLEFLVNGRNNTSGGPTETFALPAGETLLLPDLVGEVLDSSGVGTVRFAATAPVYSWARTYNLETTDDGEATYGQTILPTSAVEMIAAGTEIAYLFARGDESFRTNVACFNPENSAATLTLTAFDDHADQVGQSTYPVQPRSGTQVNNIFEALSLQYDTEVTVIATMDVSSSGYLSLVDNATGDGITVFPTVITTAGCPVPSLTLTAPASACAGDTITLSWTASTADAEVSIDGIGVGLPAVGSQQISMTGTTTFVGRASNDCGTGSDATVTVQAVSSISIVSLTADSANVSLGESVTLGWSLNAAPTEQKLSITGIGDVDLDVSDRTFSFQPQAVGTVTAALDVASACGSDSSSIEIVVAGAGNRKWHASGFGGAGNFLIVKFDPANQGVAYAVSDVAGPMYSSDGGRSWVARAAGLGNYEVSSLAIDPFDSSTLYAGSGALGDSLRRGMYVTTDSGLKWQVLDNTTDNGITYRKYRTSDTIAPHPSVQGTILTGSRSVGIWRTTDGGTSWVQVHQPPTISVAPFNDGTVEDDPASPYPAPVAAVIFDSGSSGTVYAGYDGAGVFKSTQDGALGTWQDITQGLASNPRVKGLAVGAGGNLYVALGFQGLYRSSDGGLTWRAKSQGMSFLSRDNWVTSVTADPVDPNTVYVTVWTFDFSQVWVSHDAGDSWSPLFDVLEDEGSISNLTRDVTNNPTGVWTGSYPEPTQRLAIDPADTDHLLISTYWSIYGSEDGGFNWTERSAGAQGTCVTNIVVDRGQPDTIYASHMDAGVLTSTDGGASWQTAVPTEYDETINGQFWNVRVAGGGSSNTIVYTTSDPWSGSDGQVLKSTDGGATWNQVFSNPRPDGEWMSGAMLGLAIDPSDSSTVYITQDGGEVYRSTDGGSTWASTTGQPDDCSFTYALEVDGDGRVFAGTLFGGLWRSSDSGGTWQRVLTSQNEVFRLAISSDTIYAAAGDGNLWSSSDGGDTWFNLTGFTPVDWGDEVNDQGWAVAIDPADPDHIAFGVQDSFHPADTGSGAYESTDGGATWTLINDGLGVRSPVTFAFASDGALFAGTWCGGIWKLPAASR